MAAPRCRKRPPRQRHVRWAAMRSVVRPGGSRLQRYLGDSLAALLAWYGAVWLRVEVPMPFTVGLLPMERVSLVHPVTLLVLALQLLTLYFFGYYHTSEPRPRIELATRLL